MWYDGGDGNQYCYINEDYLGYSRIEGEDFTPMRETLRYKDEIYERSRKIVSIY